MIGMQHVLLTVDVVDLSNILSGIAFSRYEISIYSSVQMSHLQNCVMILNLRVLRMARGGCGWHGMLVIERRNWGRGMVFRWRQKVLSMFWQPFWSTEHEGLPVSLPGLVLRAPQLLIPPALC